ncbi:MAG: sigma-54 dependent transcriptional regulator [Nitrospirota bacterium]|nr:sigma-54 dependent transcriptional regulator [Nitrospirota bacterium]
MKTVLIVDDELGIRESLKMILKHDYRVLTASSGIEALKMQERERPDAVFLDIRMPGMDGMQVLAELRKETPTTPVIMLTATQTLETVVEAMKLGASDYLTKPFSIQEIKDRLEKVLVERQPGLLASRSSSEVDDQCHLSGIVGESRAIRELCRMVRQIADGRSTVLITGESGTGKELIAGAVHKCGPYGNKPFVAINCAAIPENLIESELFGHEKGAFTDARERRIGKFEQAHGGTLFLDEVGDLSLATQVKLLRVLQQREFLRVGGATPIRVDVRVIAATNRDLGKDVAEGRFRHDLYYRVNVVPLHVPPLRERSDDIPLLVEHFLHIFAQQGDGRGRKISRDAMEILMEYPWPGNVRQLMNVIERCHVLCAGDTIETSDIPEDIREQVRRSSLKEAVLEGNSPFDEASREFEYDIIFQALRKTNFNQTEAASLLGISRRILKYKMDKLGITACQR